MQALPFETLCHITTFLDLRSIRNLSETSKNTLPLFEQALYRRLELQSELRQDRSVIPITFNPESLKIKYDQVVSKYEYRFYTLPKCCLFNGFLCAGLLTFALACLAIIVDVAPPVIFKTCQIFYAVFSIAIGHNFSSGFYLQRNSSFIISCFLLSLGTTLILKKSFELHSYTYNEIFKKRYFAYLKSKTEAKMIKIHQLFNDRNTILLKNSVESVNI